MSARRLPLFALIGANAISLIGTMLTAVALPWFVLETTNSPAKAGLTGFAAAIAQFAAGTVGGGLVDRLGFKRSSVIADLVSGVGIVLIPILYVTIGLAFWQLLVLVFFGALLDIPGITARRSLLPELTTMAGQPLERANAAYEGNQYLATLLGPPLAGLLVAKFGAVNVLWLDAGSFAISALVVMLAVPGTLTHSAAKVRGTFRDELIEGFRFLKQERVLRVLALSVGVTNFLGGPFSAVLLPVYILRSGGDASDLGLLIAALGAGSVVGAIVYGAIGHRMPRRATWVICYSIFPLTLWTLAANPSLLVVTAVFALVGISGGPLNPLLVTIRHERIPIALRGRVFSTFSAISVAATPLGMLLQGTLVERVGIHWTIVIVAAIYQGVGVVMFVVPSLKLMDRPSSAHAVSFAEPSTP